MESIRTENDQLNGELQRLRNEIQRLQSAYDESVSEISALKIQIDDRFLVAANTPPVDSVRKKFHFITTLAACLELDINLILLRFFYTSIECFSFYYHTINIGSII